jgi:hypothetical protein
MFSRNRSQAIMTFIREAVPYSAGQYNVFPGGDPDFVLQSKKIIRSTTLHNTEQADVWLVIGDGSGYQWADFSGSRGCSEEGG